MAKGWQSLGLHKLASHTLRSLSVTNGPAGKDLGTGGLGGGRVCSHCKTGLHAGNKAKCVWSDLPPKEAREKGRETLRNLGVMPEGSEV